ncbi:hypothetical protein MHBO_002414 [Bonamia ostreae]|uniref:Uncharacterized protein n=1 Tax=Bonamia ostreae TaxID=126728 RepID=A0ABV2AM73_9EUKA
MTEINLKSKNALKNTKRCQNVIGTAKKAKIVDILKSKNIFHNEDKKLLNAKFKFAEKCHCFPMSPQNPLIRILFKCGFRENFSTEPQKKTENFLSTPKNFLSAPKNFLSAPKNLSTEKQTNFDDISDPNNFSDDMKQRIIGLFEEKSTLSRTEIVDRYATKHKKPLFFDDLNRFLRRMENIEGVVASHNKRYFTLLDRFNVLVADERIGPDGRGSIGTFVEKSFPLILRFCANWRKRKFDQSGNSQKGVLSENHRTQIPFLSQSPRIQRIASVCDSEKLHLEQSGTHSGSIF